MPTVNSLTVTLGDRVQETTQTTGTGTYSLDGAPTGKRTFVAGIGNGVRTLYTAALGANWENGIGTVTSGAPATLSRDAILSSTNSNNAVSWGAGVKDIFCDASAALVNQIWTRPGASFSIGAIETRGPSTPSGAASVVDFTSIAATAVIIHIGWSGVVIPSISELAVIQIGDSGGIENTGYVGHTHGIDSAQNAGGGTLTNAFPIEVVPTGPSTRYGHCTLQKVGTALWTISGSTATVDASGTGGRTCMFAGSKSLSAVLDRVRIATSAAGNFTAGGSITLQIIHGV